MKYTDPLNPDFTPKGLLKHPHVQSALASFKPRNWPKRSHPMEVVSEKHTLTSEDGVRLDAYHSSQPEGISAKGHITLIHGWEGCHRSIYLYSLACTLFDAGYHVTRLNLRDHGGTHALNKAMFHSARMDEVFDALAQIRQWHSEQKFAVIGFSLGGNFALRVGLQGPDRGFYPDLSIGVCPAIDPTSTTRALDHGPKLFHRYFINKWRRSLKAKAQAWPDDYDFSGIWDVSNFTDITRKFVERYTEFDTLEDYFGKYTLAPELKKPPKSPLAILTSQDDPVVPFSDFDGIEAGKNLIFEAPQHGGHCGFIENIKMQSWAEKRILALLSDIPAKA